jgi:hypothetical protein
MTAGPKLPTDRTARWGCVGDEKADHSAVCHDCEILALLLRYNIGDGFGEALKGGISSLIAYNNISWSLKEFAELPAQFSDALESETGTVVFVKIQSGLQRQT